MFEVWGISLLSVFVVSLISLIGVFTISIKDEKLGKVLLYFVSFAAGALLGDAFIHIMPEAIEQYGFGILVSLSILAGMMVFFVLEKLIHWRHCHVPTSESHPHPFAYMNLVGDTVHNFIDGLIIGGSYIVSIPVGVATTTAVILHEIPQEIGDFGVLLHGGFTRKKALALNFLTALTAVAGTLVALMAGYFMQNVGMFLLPFAAGGFIYIASADLIPELHKDSVELRKSLLQLVFFTLGIGIMLTMLVLG
jgi:zinc and cadmium transporter